MFDLNKLGDLSKMANEARAIQEKQDRAQAQQIDLLQKISNKLDQIITLLSAKS